MKLRLNFLQNWEYFVAVAILFAFSPLIFMTDDETIQFGDNESRPSTVRQSIIYL